MRKILIHLFGGVTKQEEAARYCQGKHDMAVDVYEQYKEFQRIRHMDDTSIVNSMNLYIGVAIKNTEDELEEWRGKI